MMQEVMARKNTSSNAGRCSMYLRIEFMAVKEEVHRSMYPRAFQLTPSAEEGVFTELGFADMGRKLGILIEKADFFPKMKSN